MSVGSGVQSATVAGKSCCSGHEPDITVVHLGAAVWFTEAWDDLIGVLWTALETMLITGCSAQDILGWMAAAKEQDAQKVTKLKHVLLETAQ